jgi:hypothetical protein
MDDRFDVTRVLGAAGRPENFQSAFLKKNFNLVKGLHDPA